MSRSTSVSIIVKSRSQTSGRSPNRHFVDAKKRVLSKSMIELCRYRRSSPSSSCNLHFLTFFVLLMLPLYSDMITRVHARPWHIVHRKSSSSSLPLSSPNKFRDFAKNLACDNSPVNLSKHFRRTRSKMNSTLTDLLIHLGEIETKLNDFNNSQSYPRGVSPVDAKYRYTIIPRVEDNQLDNTVNATDVFRLVNKFIPYILIELERLQLYAMNKYRNMLNMSNIQEHLKDWMFDMHRRMRLHKIPFDCEPVRQALQAELEPSFMSGLLNGADHPIAGNSVQKARFDSYKFNLLNHIIEVFAHWRQAFDHAIRNEEKRDQQAKNRRKIQKKNNNEIYDKEKQAYHNLISRAQHSRRFRHNRLSMSM